MVEDETDEPVFTPRSISEKIIGEGVEVDTTSLIVCALEGSGVDFESFFSGFSAACTCKQSFSGLRQNSCNKIFNHLLSM